MTKLAAVLLAAALVTVPAVPCARAGKLEAFQKQELKEENQVRRELKAADREDADEQHEKALERKARHVARASADEPDADSDDIDDLDSGTE